MTASSRWRRLFGWVFCSVSTAVPVCHVRQAGCISYAWRLCSSHPAGNLPSQRCGVCPLQNGLTDDKRMDFSSVCVRLLFASESFSAVQCNRRWKDIVETLAFVHVTKIGELAERRRVIDKPGCFSFHFVHVCCFARRSRSTTMELSSCCCPPYIAAEWRRFLFTSQVFINFTAARLIASA